MKLFVSLMLVVLFTVSVGVAQENEEEWVTVKKSQLMAWRDHILALQSMVEISSAKITVLQMEVLRLQDESLKWETKYKNARKGLWVGLGAGYPLGAQGMAIYQFNERFGIFLLGGYNDVWSVNLGLLTRVK